MARALLIAAGLLLVGAALLWVIPPYMTWEWGARLGVSVGAAAILVVETLDYWDAMAHLPSLGRSGGSPYSTHRRIAWTVLVSFAILWPLLRFQLLPG